jgi:ferrous iron transport protein B
MALLVETSAPAATRALTAALIGNPNCGKTTLFNAMTGLRQKVGNYPGVTVERRAGRTFAGASALDLIDLPGTYSLANRALDEQVAVDVITGRMAGERLPDLVIAVCDASNLARNLFLTTQVVELGLPVVVALTMVDVARKDGREPDVRLLEARLGVPVVAVEARRRRGLDALREAVLRAVLAGPAQRIVRFAPAVEAAVERVLESADPPVPFGIALRSLLADPEHPAPLAGRVAIPDSVLVRERAAVAAGGIEWWSVEAAERYRWIDESIPELARDVATRQAPSRRVADRVDSVLLHRFFGPLAFVAVMAIVFQMVFSWASWPMDIIEGGLGALGEWLGTLLGPGALRDLVVDGVIAGVGSVLVFLPQIAMLFFALGLLEDSGYLARGAVIMDRLMGKVGLHGKSFVPMLSSFACAIPGIMATRSIESRSARLATIMVAPLMSCSARLPVYTLLIGAFFGERKIGGFLSLAGVIMASMYVLGIVAAIASAFVLRRTVIRGAAPSLLLELPPYRRPNVLTVLRHVGDRAKLFVVRAGTVILGLSILLWFLQAYPKNEEIEQRFAGERIAIAAQQDSLPAPAPAELEQKLAELEIAEKSAQLEQSYAGRLGKSFEPVIAPLGFDWRIGIGLVASFAAREVLVSALAIVFNVEGGDDDQVALGGALQAATVAGGTERAYRPLTALSLLVFFVLACQCMSTLAVVRRETNSWRWPALMFVYMSALAWLASFGVFQVGRLLGF